MMLDYALKSTKDFNGDGLNDQWGFMGIPDYQILYSNGGNIVTFDGNYTPQFGFDTVSNIRAMNFLVEMVFTYKVADKTAGLTWKHFAAGAYAMMAAGANGGLNLKNLGQQDHGFVAFPKGPDVNRYIAPVDVIQTHFIPSTTAAEDVPKVLRLLMDYTSVEEDEPYFMSVTDQQTTRLKAILPDEGIEQDWEVWYDLRSKQEMVYTNYFSPLKARTTAAVITPAVNMTVPLISAIDSFKSEANSIIHSYYPK
jgi:hypothetical protein